MKKDETKKELSYDQVQKIIDNQIARIEEDVAKSRGNDKENSSEICLEQQNDQCCLVAFFKRVFGRNKK